MELHPQKAEIACRMAAEAGLSAHIDHQVGDAVELIRSLREVIDFVLVDVWKDLYLPCLEAFYPKLTPARWSSRIT